MTLTKHDRKRTAVELEEIIPSTDLASMIKTLRDPDISLGDILQLDGPSVLAGSIDQIATAGLAALLNTIATPSLPAVVAGSIHIGLLHNHPIPPLPTWLPSFGPLAIGPCTSVQVCGQPSGRVGDIGFVLCAPDCFFAVETGSSKVFIGGRRAARTLDCSIHGVRKPKGNPVQAATTIPLDPKTVLKEALDKVVKNGSKIAEAGLDAGRKAIGKSLNAQEDLDRARAQSRSLALVARLRRAQATALDAAACSGAADPREAADAAFDAAQAEAEAEASKSEAEGAGLRLMTHQNDGAWDMIRASVAEIAKVNPASPLSVGTVIPWKWTVYVGGLPVPEVKLGSWLEKRLMGTKIAKAARDKWASTKLRLRSTGARAKVRIREAVAPRLRMLAGHPVDVVTGAVLTDGVDATLRGGWTLALRRHYASSWAERPGPLGYGWSHSFDVAVWIEEAERLLIHRTPDGREVMLDLPADLDLDRPPCERDLAGLVVIDPQHGLRIAAEPGGRWRITVADGDAYSTDGIRAIELAPIAGDPDAAGRRAFARARRLHGPEGASVDLDHDDRGRLLAVRQGPRRLGLRWERRAFVAGLEDRVVALTLADPDGPGDLVHTRYRYDDRGDLIAVVDALGGRLRLAYDAHRLVRETLPDGRAFTFTYDGPGPLARCLRTAGPGGVFTRDFVYDPLRRRTVIESGDESVTIVDADGYGRVRAVTDSLGARWRYAHDDLGRRTRERDPAGAETRYTYDALGCRAAARLGDGSTWSFEHDDQGRRVGAIDGAGGRWRWSYDPHGRLVEAVDPTGAMTRRAYATERRALEIFVDDDQGGETLAARLELGPAGEVLRDHRPDGGATHYSYDRRGRCVAVTDPSGARREFRYDRADRLLAAIEPDGARRSFSRDPLGRPLAIDGDGLALRLTYAPCGGLASVDAAGSPHAGLRYRYDLEGRLVEACGGDDLRHALRRDALGAVVAEVDADGRTRRFRRDACGRVCERIDADGARTTYAYDRRGNLTTIAYSDGARELFSYAADGSLLRAEREEPQPPSPGAHAVAATATERLLKRTPNGLTATPTEQGTASSRCVAELTRDACGRVTGEQLRGDLFGTARELHHTRDRSGRPRAMHVDTGLRVGFSYTRPGCAAVSAIDVRRDGVRDVLRLERDACDREIVRLLPGGSVARTRRDPRGRPLAQEVSPGDDPFDRLLGAPPSSTIDRRYAWTTGARPLDPASAQRPLTAAASDTRPATPERDAAGRVLRCSTAAAELCLRWDAAGRLREVETARGEVLRFTYDALGRRVRMMTPTATTTWIWAGDRPVVEEERRHDGALSRRQRVYAPPGSGGAADHFAPLAAVLDGDLVALIHDLVGAPLAASDRSGALVDSPLPRAAAGHHRDPTTGLHYARHRYLDPASGRFLSPDPSGLRGGLDPTAYVDDPTTQIDPLGLRGLPALAPWPENAVGSADVGPLPPEPDPPAPTPPDTTPPDPARALDLVAPSPARGALKTAYSGLRPLSRTCG